MKQLFFIPLFFIFSCSSKEVKIPEDIIAKEAMIEIYKDVHISDGMVTNQQIKGVKITNQLKKSYLIAVLKKHNISMEAYEKSNAFYENNAAVMVDLYGKVMIEISKDQALLAGEKIENKKK